MNHINKPSGFNPMESYQQYPSEKYGHMGNRVALQQDNIHQSVGKVTISEKAEVALSVVHKSMTQKFSNFENFNSEIEKIENEIINNFDFEAAAKSVMSFVNASLNEAKSRGASTNELQSLLGQARIGANQGIDEAIGELSELNVLDDDLHEGIEKARDLINIGLDKTEKNISNDKPIVENSPLQVSKTKELSTNNYISQSNTSDLSITTADGDTVNISFSALKESQSSHYYRYGIDNNKQVLSYQNSSSAISAINFSYSVHGDLDEEEIAAIASLIKDISKIENDFFKGNIDKAFNAALELGYDEEQLSSFNLELKQSKTSYASQTYKEVASYKDALNGDLNNIVKPVLEFIGEFKETRENANKILDQENDQFNKLLNSVLISQYEHNQNLLSRFNKFIEKLV